MFTLPFDVPPSSVKIELSHKITLMGSCFSTNIGSKLREFKLSTTVNPLGTLYNPYSIFNGIRLAATNCIDLNDIIESQGIYYHWDMHSDVSALSSKKLKQKIEQTREQLAKSIKHSSWLIVSPGTAFVYEWKGKKVANCHKIPQDQFEKKTLTVDEIVESFELTDKLITGVNPGVNWIFTVSPVRHIREGLIENNLSKAILLQAVHEIVANNNHCHYFPSYEIQIDELRDYRFYKKDMIHPNPQAIDYIWNTFCRCFFSSELLKFAHNWSKIRSAINHKPIHPESMAHQQFVRETILKLKQFEKAVDIQPELLKLQLQLDDQ
ncbi:MAG: GSCFA domain-containing protein [Cyclobacteriaceae bacterium]|nr:GSCFA domain-containing protein [Cyclobacteriaceae bacterium HetDA_MAG_MS6]